MKNLKIMLLLIIPLLLSLPILYNMPIINAEEPESIAIFPDNSDPIGIIYDKTRNYAWVALSGLNHNEFHGSLAKIDLNNGNAVTIYELPYDLGNGYARPLPIYITLDGDNNIWFACVYDTNNQSHPTPMIKFNPELETFDIMWADVYIKGRIVDIVYDGYYIWALFGAVFNNHMIAVNYTTGKLGYNAGYLGSRIIVDNETNVVWTHYGKFNTIEHTLQPIVGELTTPCGVAYDKYFVYYAEGIGAHGSIAQVNKTDMTIVQHLIIGEGSAWTHDLCVDTDGTIWWSDRNYHMGARHPNPIVGINEIYNSSEMCFSMVDIPSNSIWFSYVGSAGIGHVALSDIRIDINKDGKIDIKDVSSVARQYGTNENSPNWVSQTDVYEPLDGKVDIKDVALVARHFGEIVE